MKFQHLIIGLGLSLGQVSFGAVIQDATDTDVLIQVAGKLKEVSGKLDEHRLKVSQARFTWKELEQFRDEMLFAVAHDPFGPAKADTPLELLPSQLTIRLKQAWNKLNVSAAEMDNLVQAADWQFFSEEVEQFLKQRDELMYQPARQYIKTGKFSARLDKIYQLGSDIMKPSEPMKTYSVVVADPHMLKLGEELATMNQSILQLKEFRTPPPPPKKGIFYPENKKELIFLGSLTFLLGTFLSLTGFGLYAFWKKRRPLPKPEAPTNSFNYFDWLGKMESILQSIKQHEENFCENQIKLKTMALELREARKALNLADNQQDFYQSLELLNQACPKLEDHFEKQNLKRQQELTRKMISHVISLCEAVETKRAMDLEREKPVLKIIRQEQLNSVKAA